MKWWRKLYEFIIYYAAGLWVIKLSPIWVPYWLGRKALGDDGVN